MVFNKEIKKDGKNAGEMYCKLEDFRLEISQIICYIEDFLLGRNENIITNLNYRLNYMEKFHNDKIAEYIQAMEYKDFLLSPYWKDISSYKKTLAGNKCQLCNKGGELHTHHRTYSIHGYEIKRLDDLIVLCKKCHAKFHDKFQKEGEM